FSLKQYKKAQRYFDQIELLSQKWLLRNNYCLAFKLLLSKLELYQLKGDIEQLCNEGENLYIDRHDLHTSVVYRLYKSVRFYLTGKIKEAISTLNEILNEVSFKNHFFIEADIKLTLAFFYIINDDQSLAEHL